jgi:DNA-binding NarL/FixJ family response regulator
MTHSSHLPPPSVRVMVVDDQQLMRDGIASLLSIQDGITIVGTAANGQEALELAVHVQPDVVLMDVRMPVMNGVTATAVIRQQVPGCQVLMLTTFDDETYIVDALRAGAIGYLLKDIPAPDLAQAVRAAHTGIYQLDPAIALKVMASLGNANRSDTACVPPDPAVAEAIPSPTPLRKVDNLSSREIDVLRLIATGATNREIAEALVISEGTVKNHISNILGRLGLRDRTQAAIYAREAGII